MSEGGHNIPENVIERRCKRGLENLRTYYIKSVQEFILVNNSNEIPEIVSSRKNQESVIFDNQIHKLILENEEWIPIWAQRKNFQRFSISHWTAVAKTVRLCSRMIEGKQFAFDQSREL